MSDIRFEVLPGLPGTGPLPTFFPIRKNTPYSEGLVVRFHTATGPWIANFEPYHLTFFDGVFAHPDGIGVIVVAGGQVYDVDPKTRGLRDELRAAIQNVLVCHSPNILIFSDGTCLEALGPEGVVWCTRRIALDGIRRLRLDDSRAFGEASDPSGAWVPFEVDVNSGAATGGLDFSGTLTP